MKLSKPSVKLYEDALSKLQVRPVETVYIDDIPKTISVANSLGLHGILYTNHNDLIKSLHSLGVKMLNYD